MTQKEEGGSKQPIKKWALRFLRAALAVAPVVWIYARADAAASADAFSSASVPLLFVILALVFTNMSLQGVKWWMLIRRFVPDLKLGKAVSVHLESAFYSIVLPSAAQDIVKSAMLSKTHPPSVVWAATWLAKLFGLLSLLLFSAVGFVYLTNSGALPAGFRAALVSAAVIIVILGAASFSKKMTRPVRAVAAKIIPSGIMVKIENLREWIYTFKYARKTLSLTFLMSTAIHLLIIFGASLTVYAVSGKFYFLECLAFVPLVEIMVVALPLTPGGLGIREGLMALLFARLGFSGEQIALYTTISLLGSMTRVLGGAVPLIRFLSRRFRKKSFLY